MKKNPKYGKIWKFAQLFISRCDFFSDFGKNLQLFRRKNLQIWEKPSTLKRKVEDFSQDFRKISFFDVEKSPSSMMPSSRSEIQNFRQQKKCHFFSLGKKCHFLIITWRPRPRKVEDFSHLRSRTRMRNLTIGKLLTRDVPARKKIFNFTF